MIMPRARFARNEASIQTAKILLVVAGLTIAAGVMLTIAMHTSHRDSEDEQSGDTHRHPAADDDTLAKELAAMRAELDRLHGETNQQPPLPSNPQEDTVEQS
ncbi:MAG: hypothetical protein LC650_04815 [Actinobacteria bacterium]|nr:hypothetical protein [Actinomycetota bacterium]